MKSGREQLKLESLESPYKAWKAQKDRSCYRRKASWPAKCKNENSIRKKIYYIHVFIVFIIDTTVVTVIVYIYCRYIYIKC